MIKTGRHLSSPAIAAGYDRIAHTMPMPAYFYPEVIHFLGDIRGQRVLDAGCGNGALLRLLATRGPARLHGLEMSPELCDLARRSLQGEAEIRCGCLEETLPYPDHSFDLVLLTEVMEHLLRPEAALREVVRVVKPSGRILITMPNGSAYQPFAGLAYRRGGRGLWIAFLPWEHPVKTRQPIDTVYSYNEIRTLVTGSGLVIERFHGREAFPYVWDCLHFGAGPRVHAVFGALDSLRPAADRLLNRLGVRRVFYRLFMACRPAPEGRG